MILKTVMEVTGTYPNFSFSRGSSVNVFSKPSFKNPIFMGAMNQK